MTSSTSTPVVESSRSIRTCPKVSEVVACMIMVAIALIAIHYEYLTLSTFLLLGALACLPSLHANSQPLTFRDTLKVIGGAVLGLALILVTDRILHNWPLSPTIRHFVAHPAFLTAVWFIYLTAVLRRRQKLLHVVQTAVT